MCIYIYIYTCIYAYNIHSVYIICHLGCNASTCLPARWRRQARNRRRLGGNCSPRLARDVGRPRMGRATGICFDTRATPYTPAWRPAAPTCSSLPMSFVTAIAPLKGEGEVLLQGVGTLRYPFPPNASVQWQPGDLTVHAKKCFLGDGFLGAPPISLNRP